MGRLWLINMFLTFHTIGSPKNEATWKKVFWTIMVLIFPICIGYVIFGLVHFDSFKEYRDDLRGTLSNSGIYLSRKAKELATRANLPWPNK